MGTPRTSYEFVEGWGMAAGRHGRVLRPADVEGVRAVLAAARAAGERLTLRGSGCSYGDASVPASGEGWVLDISRLNGRLELDTAKGEADVDGGGTIRQLWQRGLPEGYWPKVVSGTMEPTMAGAAGMNIHGKNNFKVGTFGDNLLELDLILPSGELVTCDREREPDLFHAAVGGFGMLGVITRVRTRLQRVHSGDLWVKGISCHDLGEMMAYIDAHTAEADYLVGWLDCFAGEDASGRGLIHHARYLAEGEDEDPARTLQVAYQELPASVLGFPKAEVWRALRLFNHDWGMRLVNAVKQVAGRMEGYRGWYRQPHAAFNFLLDYVPRWKFAYGRRPGHGLIQYQTFLPAATAHAAYRELLAICRRRGHVSYLGVLKRHRPDPFWMTHAVDGWSLALDFKVTPANRTSLWAMCAELTALVLDAGGRFYFAKDLVLGPEAVRRAYPEARREAFLALRREVDPEGLFDSALFRRAFGDGDGLIDPPRGGAGRYPASAS